MLIQIQLNNRTASIKENHMECVTVMGRDVGGNLSGDEETWICVMLSAAKLMTWLTEFRDNFQWTPDTKRLSTQKHLILSGETIETPVIYSPLNDDKSIQILDGRHRIAALNSLGATLVPVMVPFSQSSLFKSVFI